MVSQHKIPLRFCSVGLRGVWKWIGKGGLGVLQPYLARYLLYSNVRPCVAPCISCDPQMPLEDISVSACMRGFHLSRE